MAVRRQSRSLLFGSILTLLVVAGCPGAVAAQATPEATPVSGTQGAAIPATPAGGQLVWLLDQLNTDPAVLTDDEVAARFSADFLAQVPASQVVDLVRQLAAAGPWSVATIVEEQGDHSLKAIIRGPATALLVTVSVEPDEPHRFNGLLLEPAPAVSWDEVDAGLARLGPRVSFLAAEVAASGCDPLQGVAPDRRLAIGSAFKLYVLGELARQVAAGEASWDELLPIDDRSKSLPSGDMRNLPAGTEHTLRYYAEVMISQSDNTATDHLIARLGRENVEAIQATMGHGDPTLNMPFLTTRELFTLKLAVPEATRRAYAEGTPEERRALLEGEVAATETPGLAETATFAAPILIDRLEWFASAADLCNALAYLHDQSRQPGLLPVAEILSLSPGIAVDRATWPTIFFKGGSEPGVLNLTYLLVRADGRVFVVTGSINNPDGPVDLNLTGALLQSAIGLLAQTP